MSEFKGTKGKWECVNLESTYKTDYMFIEADGIGIGTVWYRYDQEANAKLIACAPEMLEMLNKINDFIDKNRYKNYMVELLRREVLGIEQLIKKATS